MINKPAGLVVHPGAGHVMPRRPFQGGRYFPAEDSPPDLPKGRALDDVLPPALALALAEIGLR